MAVDPAPGKTTSDGPLANGVERFVYRTTHNARHAWPERCEPLPVARIIEAVGDCPVSPRAWLPA